MKSPGQRTHRLTARPHAAASQPPTSYPPAPPAATATTANATSTTTTTNRTTTATSTTRTTTARHQHTPPPPATSTTAARSRIAERGGDNLGGRSRSDPPGEPCRGKIGRRRRDPTTTSVSPQVRHRLRRDPSTAVEIHRPTATLATVLSTTGRRDHAAGSARRIRRSIGTSAPIVASTPLSLLMLTTASAG
jgi:hypothetical protein